MNAHASTALPTAEPKHGGCSDCGNRSEAVLTSVIDPTKHLQSKAVCSSCLCGYPEGRK